MAFDEQELRVLKTLITDKKSALDFVSECDDKIFSSDLWNFAHIICSYINNNKNLPTLRILTEKLQKGNNEQLIKKITTVWNELEKVNIDEKEYRHDLEKVKRRYAEKQLLSSKDLLNKLDSGSIDINKTIGELQKTIQTIKSLDKNSLFFNKDVKEYLPLFVEKFNSKKNNPDLDRGLMTKYSVFDFATNGLKPADFVLVAGESGSGKSILLQNMAVQIWLQDNKLFDDKGKSINLTNTSIGKDIIYFSLEMPYEDCFNRFLSKLSGVPTRNIENANISKTDHNKIKVCLEFIKNYPYQFKIVDIVDASANDIETILVDAGEKFDAIFIDYLGIMHPNKGHSDEQDWLKQGMISYEIRAIARKFGTPIFSAVQLNRKTQSKDTNDAIGLARLARSATIATHATHVVQIEQRVGEENHPEMSCFLIKNRKEPKGN